MGTALREDLEQLREAVADALMQGGFREDWEPNELGLRLEGLIDILAPWEWGFDD
jgi:hypothetical protein